MAGNEQQERAAQKQDAFEQRGPAHQVVLPDRRESDEAEHDGNEGERDVEQARLKQQRGAVVEENGKDIQRLCVFEGRKHGLHGVGVGDARAHDGGEAHGGVISESMLNHIMMNWAWPSAEKPIPPARGLRQWR